MKEGFTNKQRLILTIYYGYAYSMERDLSMLKMEEKARGFVEKYGNDLRSQSGGGFAIMLMEKALRGESIYKGKELDESIKRAMLSIAIGFEMTCTMVKLWPSFMLPLCRFLLSPSLKDLGFRKWTMQNNKLLNYGVTLIDGLVGFPKDIDTWKVVFFPSQVGLGSER